MCRANKVSSNWRRLTLAQQYAVISSIVLILGMLSIGFWVQQKIQNGVVQNSAAATALYMDSMVAPQIQELAFKDTLSKSVRKRIDDIITDTPLGTRILSAKIWQPGGYIVYSSNKALLGKVFKPTQNLKNAWDGKVSAEFDSLHDEEDAHEKEIGIPLLEMYVPIRQKGTERIIAVAEFYATGGEIQSALKGAFRDTWLIVGSVAILMLSALYIIVRRGSTTIETQRASLQSQVLQLTELAAQNEHLHMTVQRAYRRSAELNERFLRKIGAELHDGPAQLIGLALLNLGAVKTPSGKSLKSDDEDERIVQVLSDALKDIRSLSAGLAVPEIQGVKFNDALELAISNHESRTNTVVEKRLQNFQISIPEEITVCTYRFVQEGLNNAFRHAAGKGQFVEATQDQDGMVVQVSDEGDGITKDVLNDGIGLRALRDRIEALGGTFSIGSAEPTGACLRLRFSLQDLRSQNG